MLIEPATERVARQALGQWKPQPVLTYLANDIAKVPTGDVTAELKGIPYSTIAAIDPAAGGPLVPGGHIYIRP